MGYANLCRDVGRLIEADTLYAHAEAVMDSTEAGVRPYFGECLTDHAYLRSLQGRHAEAESLVRAGVRIQRGDAAEDDPALAEAYVLWAVVRIRAGDPDGAVDRLERAFRCGVSEDAIGEFPELASLRSHPDYPKASPP
jgi:hypothetical protein